MSAEFDELYTAVKTRFGDGSGAQAMGDWICANTSIKKRPMSFEDYQFQKAIADDMHPDLSVKKCSQIGLALDLNTPIITPDGWTTMGELEVGDTVYDENGHPARVEYVSPIYVDHACYEVTFDDGLTIVADAGHRWFVESERAFDLSGTYAGCGRPPQSAEMFKDGVLTTEQIHRHHKKGARNRFAIPNTKPLQGANNHPPVDAYFLGLWLGDGNSHACVLTAHINDVVFYQSELERRDLVCLPSSSKGNTVQFKVHLPGQRRPGRGAPNSVSWRLTQLGLLKGAKFIPNAYLRASEAVRRDLLCGLMDTDGSITKSGRCSFYNCNPALVSGVEELARSLGYKTRTRWRKPKPSQLRNGHAINSSQMCAEVSFVAYAEDAVFLLPRKRERLKQRGEGRATEALRRRIVSVTPTLTVPVRCISVNSPNRLFLAGRGMIPTHNTEIQIRKFLAILTRNTAIAGIFTLPNEKMFTRIYNGRIRPILEADAIFNPPTANAPVRRRDQIQIRDSFGYITGCTEGDATSTSADFLMHDELDLSPQNMIALYQSRLQNSTMQITQKFSTPSFVNYGIDKAYALSDQREYVVRCRACNHYQIPRFTPEFVFIPNYRFEVTNFTDLTAQQIAQLDLDNSYVKCEHCHKQLDLTDPRLREWVATYPSRTQFRGYQVRPFSTTRLKPKYVFGQLAKYAEDGFPRGFYNTVLGESYTEASAQIQRGDIEVCMAGGDIPDISSDVPVFLGVDIGFVCHLTLSCDNEDGTPRFILFETVPASQLETRVSELRKIYSIVQGCADRFPFTPTVDALRDATSNIVMPVQYRGNAPILPQKDELGYTTHYSANRTLILDRIHTLITNHKMVLAGYTSQKETLIAHLGDMVRDEQPDVEAEWKKITGSDHYFHAMALSLLARRVCDHMYHTQSQRVATSSTIVTVHDTGAVGNLLSFNVGSRRMSRFN